MISSTESCRRRAGVSLLELLVVVSVMGVLFGISVPRIRASLDRAGARGAVQDGATAVGYARRLAVNRRASVAVRFDTIGGRVVVHAGAETLMVRPLRDRYGVTFRTTRDSLAFDARGLGFGAANLSVVMRRGQAVETLFVARLGRIRR